jgi:hypothetical protein
MSLRERLSEFGLACGRQSFDPSYRQHQFQDHCAVAAGRFTLAHSDGDHFSFTLRKSKQTSWSLLRA